MATNVNTNVAQELNITHRKNDSFELEVSIKDSASGLSFNLSQAQNDSAVFMSSIHSGAGILPVYQAKLTIKKRNSQFETLNLHTYFWKDENLTNIEPTAIQTGRYYGEKTGGPFINGAGNQSKLYAGIYLYESTGSSADENIIIKAPSEYMSFNAGDYIYDLQIRRRDEFSQGNDSGSIYTTWLFGTFKLIEDVTQV